MTRSEGVATTAVEVIVAAYDWDATGLTSQPSTSVRIPSIRLAVGQVAAVGRLVKGAAGGPLRRDVRAGQLGSFEIDEFPHRAVVVEPFVRSDGAVVVAVGCETSWPERFRLQARDQTGDFTLVSSATVQGGALVMGRPGLVFLQYSSPQLDDTSWSTLLRVHVRWEVPERPGGRTDTSKSSAEQRMKNSDDVFRQYLSSGVDDSECDALALAVLAVAPSAHGLESHVRRAVSTTGWIGRRATSWTTPVRLVNLLRNELYRAPDELDVVETVEDYLRAIDPSSLTGLGGAQMLARFLASRDVLPPAALARARELVAGVAP